MIRTLTASAILGALIASVGVYTINSRLWLTVMGSASGDPEHTADVEAASESWPICTTTVDTRNLDAIYNAVLKEYAKVRSEFATAGSPAIARTYGLGHAPTAEEIRAANARN
ncbi:MAG TPA: hypothetical protein VGG11_08150 [Xanthobacteraceae bacterium]|jgi:hypothetical protein